MKLYFSILVLVAAVACYADAAHSTDVNSQAHDSRIEKLLRQLQDQVRQGNEESAKSTIKEIGSTKSKIEIDQLSQVADFLIGKERWNLAKAYLEQVPQCAPGWGYILVKHWCAESKNNQEQLSRVDQWIKDRLPANPEYWWTQRVTFADQTGRRDQLFAELERTIKHNPHSLDDVRRYIISTTQSADHRSLNWLHDAVNPTLAYDNYRVAEWLRQGAAKEAIYYLKRAQSLKFTAADRKAIEQYNRRYTAMPAFSFDPAKAFSNSVRSMLAECYNKTGENKAAQDLLLQLSKETKGLQPSYALSQLAGQIQSTTPTHPLEDQIKRAEPENKNSIDYWQGRASYYQGRNDVDKQKDAILHALDLATFPAPKNDKTDHKSDDDASYAANVRSIVAYDYARFLLKNQSEAAALSFLWKEFDTHSNLEYRIRTLRNIEQNFETDQTHYLLPSDQRLWSILSQRNKWDSFEERILWRMVRNVSAEQREVSWKRAEDLANGNPSREAILGWIMNRTGEEKRSIPILISACATKDDEIRQNAQFTLFESYIKVCDWKQAELLWPVAAKHLTNEEKPSWIAQIAVAAGHSGDKENAMRLWRSKDQLDFSALGYLDQMAKNGMKEELISYYQSLKKSKPESTVPIEALRKLAR